MLKPRLAVFIPDVTPNQYESEKVPDPLVYMVFIDPESTWRWFVLEYNREDLECYGLVIGHEAELGNFSLEEISSLERIRPIENWQPTPLSLVRKVNR